MGGVGTKAKLKLVIEIVKLKSEDQSTQTTGMTGGGPSINEIELSLVWGNLGWFGVAGG